MLLSSIAGTMNQVDSQIVHVKGEDRMFSCYGLDDIVREDLMLVSELFCLIQFVCM
jgi:hypothetical protein